LAQLAKQNVYVPYSSVAVFAEAAKDSGATVGITTASGDISNLSATVPTAVTVTVSKDSLEVDPIYKTASYTLDLYYGAGMAVSPEAEGGNVSFIPGPANSNVYYEVHTFDTAGTYTLSFGAGTESITADVFIVAGGGGSGGDYYHNAQQTDFAGGGGAGGLLYKTGYPLTLSGGSVSVVVGAGGEGGPVSNRGSNGGDSWIGLSATDNNGLNVPGGGGGGGSYYEMNGGSGGSGGGGGSGSSNNYGVGGTGSGNPSNADGEIQGSSGGSGGGKGTDAGGGGGGAAGIGQPSSGNECEIPGDGGPGWRPDSDYDKYKWIYDVTQTAEFSHGGKGGGTEANDASPTNGVNYGDGGSGGNNKKQPGANGHSGIVIVRFQRILGTKTEKG
jgi:hypothetical protein